MNLGTMKTALARYAGVDSSDPLTDWINATLHEFEDAYPWPFLEALATQNTVAGDDNLALPADFFKVITMRITTAAIPLKYIGWIQFEEEISDPTATGEPHTYTLVGLDTAILYPVPDAVYPVRLKYKKLVADLAADVDVPGIPTKYHYPIVMGAASKALQAESNEERATTALELFNSAVSSAIQAFSERQEASFGQVRDSQGYGEI